MVHVVSLLLFLSLAFWVAGCSSPGQAKVEEAIKKQARFKEVKLTKKAENEYTGTAIDERGVQFSIEVSVSGQTIKYKAIAPGDTRVGSITDISF